MIAIGRNGLNQSKEMGKMRVMLIEDDRDMSALIQMYLQPEGWEVDVFHMGKEAVLAFNRDSYQILLLDLMLPDMTGFDICQAIRKESTIPIIMLTALEQSIHKIQGLNMGADDYIIKPFDPGELIARIRAQLRRTYDYVTNPSLEETDQRRVKHLTLNKKFHQAYYQNQEIKLTPKEFAILWLLMEDPQGVYSMDDIHTRIWGDAVLDGEVNPVMVHVRRIRSKFEKIGVDIIQTVWGVGYRINA